LVRVSKDASSQLAQYASPDAVFARQFVQYRSDLRASAFPSGLFRAFSAASTCLIQRSKCSLSRSETPVLQASSSAPFVYPDGQESFGYSGSVFAGFAMALFQRP
jgi:hypothetical protein